MAKQDKWVALEGWLTYAQERLNISNWRITVVRGASEVDAWADIAPHSQAATADLRLSNDFWALAPDRQRDILTHELLHLITCRTDQVFEALEESLGKIAYSVLEPQYDNAAERAVDHIALLLAQTLPLPELPK